MTERSAVRLIVLRALVLGLLVTLLGRLWYLQVVTGDEYTKLAVSNRVRDVVTQPARGEVLDAAGRPLVRNRTAMVVSVTRSTLLREPDDGRSVLERLAKVLGIPYADLYARIQPCGGSVKPPCWNGSPYQPVPVKQVDDPRVALAIEEHRDQFPGVKAELAAVREYPQGSLAAHVLGYLSPISEEEYETKRDRGYLRTDRVGRAGLEESYDTFLRGVAGVQQVAVDRVGTVAGVVHETPPRAGYHLVTSLDARVQRAAEQALADGVKNAKAKAGAAVVMEAKTGRIVAMASYPSYDPKVWIGGISGRDYRALTDERAGVPLISRVTQGEFAPASTFKIISSAAAVMDGYPLHGIYPCPGSYRVGNRSFRNFESIPLGPVSFRLGLVKSCDTMFYKFAYEQWLRDEARLRRGQKPLEPMPRMAKAFGFGRQTGIDLPGESDGRILDRADKRTYWEANKEDYCAGAKRRPKGTYLQQLAQEFCDEGWRYRAGNAANFSIGQGDTSVTPLQLAVAYAAIANGGTIVQPQLAKALVGPEGRVGRLFAPKTRGKVPVTAETLAYIKDALAGVTTEGTARGAFAGFPIDRVHVAGKTGTGQVQGKNDTAWFASFAPAADPDYVVVAVIPESAGTGGTYAAPVVREIYEAIYGFDGRPAAVAGGGPLTRLPSSLPDGTKVWMPKPAAPAPAPSKASS